MAAYYIKYLGEFCMERKIDIVIPEEFDGTDRDFLTFKENIQRTIDSLDESASVLLYRVPDDIDLESETENLTDFMQLLREVAADIAPNWLVLGLMFDLTCEEHPNFIIKADSDLAYDYTEESIRNYLTLLKDSHKTIETTQIIL